MAEATLTPASGTPYHDAWTRVGGTNKWGVLEDASDSTWIESLGDGGAQQQSVFLDPLPGGVGAITEVRGNSRVSVVDGASIGVRLYLASATYTQFRVHVTTTITTYNDDVIARPGGGAWQRADFDVGVAQLGCGNGGSQGFKAFMYEGSVEVTYTPAAGGFAYLMGCWLPPLLAAASHGLSLSDLAAFLKRRDPRARTGYAFKVRPGGPSERDELGMIHRAHFVRPRFAF